VKTGAGAYTQNFDQNDPEPMIAKRPLTYCLKISRRRIYLWATPQQQLKEVDWPINQKSREFQQSLKLARSLPK
jgi:hypothetical protein